MLLHVNPSSQQMHLYKDSNLIVSYEISTAANGLGEEKNSYATPRGWHYIRAFVGEEMPLGAVFVGRRWTKEIFNNELFINNKGRDWILTRILWLSGLENGLNRLGNVDTMQRYIYIHGSPSQRMKLRPMTRGCIGMYQDDIINLFDRLVIGTRVFIGEKLK
ncbi:MAG: L,D-transpeptidase [Francisellaceae bacterium]|jgi:L,D-transpeptidase YbiS|nr:L,D-transpeptidase [Francisellaceae bacterium]MBT6538345.1 L,D-transpeptidase [Francisellaceae bacterium]